MARVVIGLVILALAQAAQDEFVACESKACTSLITTRKSWPGLWPPSAGNGSGTKNKLPYTAVIDMKEPKELAEVVVLSDWWQKRPTSIRVCGADVPFTHQCTTKTFAHYASHICGPRGIDKCEYNGSESRPEAVAQMRVPISFNKPMSRIRVTLRGLLSAPNKFVILKGIKVVTAKALPKAKKAASVVAVSASKGPYWCPVKVELGTRPTVVTYEVKGGAGSEMIGAFSLNKREWAGGKGGEDGLTWYAAPHRADFTFRTHVFGGFPRITKSHQRKVTPGVWHRVQVRLSRHSASYSVDGKHFATAKLKKGEITQSGYVGMIRYASDYQFRALKIVNAEGHTVWPQQKMQAQKVHSEGEPVIEPEPRSCVKKQDGTWCDNGDGSWTRDDGKVWREDDQQARAAVAAVFNLSFLAVFALVGLLGLCWGLAERQRRRRLALAAGGFPTRSGDLLTGLFECFGHPRVCLPACLFTPCAAAFNRAAADNRECTACDAVFSCKTQLTQYHTRQTIRAQHNLSENEVSDAFMALCCTACAVGQDTLELERRATGMVPPQQALEVTVVAPGAAVAPGAEALLSNVVKPPAYENDECTKQSV